jgi:hypothetical protein
MADESRFLIAIGSPESPGMGLQSLSKVKTDVERMTEFFTSPNQNYQRVLADEISLGAEASRIKHALEKWFSDDSRREDDCVVIYFAGHGEQRGNFGQHYLFTSDSDPKRLTSTAIETGELPKLFFAGEGQRPQSVLLILDTCYGGEGGGKAAAALAAVRRDGLNGMGAGFYVLASAGPNDTAGDGAFVDAFLRVMDDPQLFGIGAAEYCSFDDIYPAVNACFGSMNTIQQAVADSIGGTKKQRFIRNRGHVPLLAGHTLEALLHWDLTSRGVEDATFAGDFFVGRETALAQLRQWLEAPRGDRKARVVTGDPGSGKSAVLGRLMMEETREQTRTPNVSVYARRLSPAQIAESFARQLKIDKIDLTGVLQWLSQPGPPILIVVDALDEALDVRATADRLLIPLARLDRVRMVVGTRKDPSGSTPMGSGMMTIDLDAPEYFRRADIDDYVLRRLTDAGSGALQQYGGPVLEALARKVVDRGGHSFLYARVVSRWLATADLRIDTGSSNWIDQIDIPNDAAEAFGRDLDRFDPARKRAFIDLLMPLAYAQGKGLPQKKVWQQVATAIAGRSYTVSDIRDLKEQASYYITRDIEDEDTVYRLFHEAFAQYLRTLSRDESAELAIYGALRDAVPRANDGRLDWSRVLEPYILNYLAVHAMHAGRLGELLADTEFLLHATPQTLAAVLRAMPPDATGRARAYLHAYPHLLHADPPTRAQYLALAAARFNSHTLFDNLQSRKSECNWFPAKVSWHRDPGSHVIARAVGFETACLLDSAEGIPNLAMVTGNSIRVLSLATGEDLQQFAFPGADALSAIEVPSRDRASLAVAFDGYVLLVDLAAQTWSRMNVPSGQPPLSVIDPSGEQKLVIGDDGGFSDLRKIKAHKAVITFVGYGVVQNRKILITGSDSYRNAGVTDSYQNRSVREDQQLRIWDAATLNPLKAFTGPEGDLVQWSALVEVGGKAYLLGYFRIARSYRLYDLETAKEVAASGEATSRPFGTAIANDHGAMVLSGFSDEFRLVRLVETSAGPPIIEANASITLDAGLWLGPIQTGKRSTLVSVGNRVRVWDLELLAQRAEGQVEAKVGQLREDGEPLFCLSAPAGSRYFAGLSRLGNLWVWSSDGRIIGVRQVVASLEETSANDFDYLQMIDFGDECLYVTAGRSGVMQAWHLDGRPASPKQNFGVGSVSAFRAHVAGTRLLAIVAARLGRDYRISAWDLLRGDEVTTTGRFDVEGYLDKSIDHLVVVEDGGRTIIVGALGHSAYHEIRAWDLGGAPVEARLQELWRKHRLPPQQRNSLWRASITRDIKCMGVARCSDTPVVVIGDAGGWITVLRGSDGRQLSSYQAHDKQVVDVSGSTIGGRDALISAGSDGGIVVVGSLNAQGGLDPGRRISIDVGDHITAMAAVPDDRVVVGTEEGFVLLELTAPVPSGPAGGNAPVTG